MSSAYLNSTLVPRVSASTRVSGSAESGFQSFTFPIQASVTLPSCTRVSVPITRVFIASLSSAVPVTYHTPFTKFSDEYGFSAVAAAVISSESDCTSLRSLI